MTSREVIEGIRRVLESETGRKVYINEEILGKVESRGWNCLCKFATKCPCMDVFLEVKQHGRCKCGLFYTEDSKPKQQRLRLRLQLSQKNK